MSLASLEWEEVEQFTREFEALFNAGDAAGMASYYAEDPRLLAERPPGPRPRRDRAVLAGGDQHDLTA